MEFEKIYQKYIAKLGIKTPQTFKEVEAVFLLARKDFLNYKISVDQFSAICDELHISMRNKIDLLTTHLESVLISGAELSWYIRQRPKEDAMQLNYFLQYIHDYKKK